MIHICASDIAETIKTELRNAKKYAEGTGIRIDVKGASVIPDLKKLVTFKIAN